MSVSDLGVQVDHAHGRKNLREQANRRQETQKTNERKQGALALLVIITKLQEVQTTKGF